MLKHWIYKEAKNVGNQPPSGRCVLKPVVALIALLIRAQPPSGRCVLKQQLRTQKKALNYPAAFRPLCVETMSNITRFRGEIHQPPSGRCVLKHDCTSAISADTLPAAFRRLCVETKCKVILFYNLTFPAAFRRLCVETKDPLHAEHVAIPAAFRRLCVETSCSFDCFVDALTSRLQAAVC